MHVNSIGVLHPGEMGAAVGAALARDHTVRWASSGRSRETARRASDAGFVDAGSVDALRSECELIISLCPPGRALEVARQVAGFQGLYLDANAVAPATAREIAGAIEGQGGRYVDGGIIGPPPTGPHSGTRLYLSGPDGPEVARLFEGTAVSARPLSDGPTAASGLKMCFAAWTKGTAALLLDIRALAESLGLGEALLAEWSESVPDAEPRSVSAAQQAATKGWRWQGEMDEIAQTFREAGLPDGFHRAASEVYGAVVRDEKAERGQATLDIVVGSLIRHADGGSRAQ